MARDVEIVAGPVGPSAAVAVADVVEVQTGSPPVLLPIARPVGPALPADTAHVRLRRADGLAVASAVCGFTVLVPVVSQLAGLVLGAASLMRIRRARRCGVSLPGAGWAAAGIISSALVLVSWIIVFAAFAVVGTALTRTADALGAIAPSGG